MPAPSAELDAPAASPFRLLLVEDNLTDARLVELSLAEASEPCFELVHVRRTQEAIRRLGHESFDVVLLDLGLPDANELEALNQLRAAAPELPIVVLTGRENEALAVQAMRQGAQDYLVKGWSNGPALARSIRCAIERKRTEQHVNHLAYHDPLTDLPNRLLLRDRLDQALARARRQSAMLAVVFIDLDLFKSVNDTLGHTTGDELLLQVAERLKGCIRESDTAARIGGDEFALVLSEIVQIEDARRAADRVAAIFSQPFRLASHEVHVSASIGVSLYPTNGADAETLLRNADAAMYLVKKLGRRHLRFFDRIMNGTSERLTLGAELRRALERNEFVVHYQPQIELDDRTVVGVEALVRWQHPRRGLLAPQEFISVAEDTGLIGLIDEWVLREVCGQVARWKAEGIRWPIDLLKIDPGFVHDGPHDAADAAIVRSIVTLARGLSVKVLAEGVETKAQMNFLRDNGCDRAQGFYLCRPLPAGELTGFLRRGRCSIDD